jgi:hypothetical protein
MWSQYIPSNSQWTSTGLHGVTSQKLLFFIITAVTAWKQFSMLLHRSFAGRWVPRTLSAWQPDSLTAAARLLVYEEKTKHTVTYLRSQSLLTPKCHVTNNNVFWIGWLDLLTPSCTISLNYNQLQQLAINLLPRTRSILVLLSQFSYNFWTAELPSLFVFSCAVTDLVLIYESLTSASRMRPSYKWMYSHVSSL